MTDITKVDQESVKTIIREFVESLHNNIQARFPNCRSYAICKDVREPILIVDIVDFDGTPERATYDLRG